MQKSKKLKIAALVCGIILVLGLLASIGVNIYLAYFNWDSYLQSPDEIYVMEAGILKNNLEFQDGEDFEPVS